MKQATRNWAEHAEADFAAATDLLALPRPHFAVVCFHAQQTAEKYLKALLQEHDIRFPRTHNLATLATLLDQYLPDLAPFQPRLVALSTHAVDTRYGGPVIQQAHAEVATQTATDIRALARSALGLPANDQGEDV